MKGDERKKKSRRKTTSPDFCAFAHHSYTTSTPRGHKYLLLGVLPKPLWEWSKSHLQIAHTNMKIC